MFDRSTMREVMLCHEIGFPSRSTVALIKQILQGYPFLNTTPPVKYPSPPVGWEDRIQRHFYKNDMPGLKEPDYSFVTTIRDMRSFCREKGYSLVLFNAPVSPMYYTHIPSAYKQLTDSVIHTLVDNQTTFYLDYSRHPLPDSCYYDSDHTNFYGANLITPLVCDSLRKMGVLPMP
jgi:hypothetical protein